MALHAPQLIVGARMLYLVWLPADLPIVPVLQERSWKIAYRSETSIVLQRSAPRTADMAKPSVAPRVP